jgi:hypothetical protein
MVLDRQAVTNHSVKKLGKSINLKRKVKDEVKSEFPLSPQLEQDPKTQPMSPGFRPSYLMEPIEPMEPDVKRESVAPQIEMPDPEVVMIQPKIEIELPDDDVNMQAFNLEFSKPTNDKVKLFYIDLPEN